MVWSAARAVLQHDSAANVLSGCVLAIEGCMDSRAINYDPDATENSNSWCVLPREGCMLPSAATLQSTASKGSAGDLVSVSDRAHTFDGAALAVNHDPLATVHTPAACRIERRGCLSPTALNFDPVATLPAPCYQRVLGCLQPTATNFNCSLGVTIANLTATAAARNMTYADIVASHSCVVGGAHDGSEMLRATVDSNRLCIYPPPPPYALYAGLAAAVIAMYACVCTYLRRRSAKVDAATAYMLASSFSARIRTHNIQPMSTATVRALAATANAVRSIPERQRTNAYAEVIALRTKLRAAAAAASAAARLASEVDQLHDMAASLREELAELQEAKGEVEDEFDALSKRFLTLVHQPYSYHPMSGGLPRPPICLSCAASPGHWAATLQWNGHALPHAPHSLASALSSPFHHACHAHGAIIFHGRSKRKRPHGTRTPRQWPSQRRSAPRRALPSPQRRL